MSALVGLLLCLLFLSGSVAMAADDPVSVRIECNPSSLSGPSTITVSIQVFNVGDDDLPGSVTLYDPSGNVVTDFGSGGSVNLGIAQAQAWSGKWNVTEEQLKAGKIVFKVAYSMYDDAGQRISQSKPVSARIFKKEGEPQLKVERVVLPKNPVKGQEMTVSYTLINTGTVEILSVRVEDKGLLPEPILVESLPAGEKVNRSYTFIMGEKITSEPIITYKGPA
ncbi:MAG: hypothetical protein RR482_05410, partial [Clostridia bacterium]